MGRHSSPERTPFFRSVGAWALPWLLILAVLAVALFVVMDMVSNDPVRTAASGDDPEVVTPEPTADESSEKSDDEKDEPEDKPAKKEAAKNDPMKKEPKENENEAPEPKLITEGIQVQVLNGTGADDADDLMADKLARLGYSVVAVSPIAKTYPDTVVFWTGDSQDVATALAERFNWSAEPAPSNLSTEVQLHVVVGGDQL